MELQENESRLVQARSIVDALERKISQLENKKAELASTLQAHQAALEATEEDIEETPAEKIISSKKPMSLLKRAFSGWKEFSIQRAKLTLHLRLKQDRQMTRVFTTWKRYFTNHRQERLDVLIAAREIRQQRLREESEFEDQEAIKRRELGELRKRLEQSPPRRIVSKNKLYREQLAKKAEIHFKKSQSARLAEVFSEWKAANKTYRDQQYMNRRADRQEIVRKVFSGFKLLTERLVKSKEIALERKIVHMQKIKKSSFKALKANLTSFKSQLKRIEHISSIQPKKYFCAWKEYTEERLEEREKETFVHRRVIRLRKDFYFRMLKIGLQITRRHQRAFNLINSVRETVIKRRKFNLFLERTEINSRATKQIKSRRLSSIRYIFDNLKDNCKSAQNKRYALNRLVTWFDGKKADMKRGFVDVFVQTCRRSIMKQRVRLCNIGCG